MLARNPSGKLIEENHWMLLEYTMESMQLWRVWVTVHDIEDPLFVPVKCLDGIGNLGEDFLE
jgi:hypothetical protein